MVDPEIAEDTPDPNDEAFYLQYGKAMAAWADVESALSDWFRRAIQPHGGENVNAEGIFYSARSFQGRADMLKAATHSNHLSKDQRTFVRKSVKIASDYNTFRAKLAHRMAIKSSGYGPGKDGMFLREGDDWRGLAEHHPSIDTVQLKNATDHFGALHWLIVITDIPGGKTLGEGLQLIARLPKEPHLPADIHLLEDIHSFGE